METSGLISGVLFTILDDLQLCWRFGNTEGSQAESEPIVIFLCGTTLVLLAPLITIAGVFLRLLNL